MEWTAPKRKLVECEGSDIASLYKKKYFQSFESSCESELTRLKKATENSFSNGVREAFNEYCLAICNLVAEKQKDEVKYVQPIMSQCLRKIMESCPSMHFEVIDEKEYTLEQNSDSESIVVTGKTDHTIKLQNFDAHIVTVEDKHVGNKRIKHFLSQAKSQIMAEVVNLETGYACVLVEYVGILQNGIVWYFVFRRISIHNSILWNYVECPPILNDIGAIDEQNCEIVSKFLEHAFLVAMDIAVQVRRGGALISTVMASDGLDEGGEESDGDDEEGDRDERKDDDAGKYTDEWDEEEGNVDEGGEQEGHIEGHLSSSKSSQRRKRSRKNGSNNKTDNNFLFPLTTSFVKQLPSRRFIVF